MANYVIVGAGRDASHPIQVNVRCDDSTTICWTGKYCKTVCGVEMCAEDQYCETVSTTSEGPHQTTWTDPDGVSHTIYYNVKRDCPPVVPPSCEYTCSDLTAYAVPSSVVESYTGNIDIHYEYYLTCVSGDYIGDRVKKSGVKTVPFSSFSDYSYNLSVDGCNTTVKLDKKGEDDCTVGCVADISITFSQDIVPASGKTIQVIVSFKKTVTDENCKKKVTTGSFSYPWEVKCTPVDENDKHCCKDHYVQGWISEAEVKRLGKLDGCELRYDGEQTALDFYYKVLQRGKTTEECEGYCEEKTTYCVDQSTVKVCYEKRYLSNEWVCEGDPSTDCDCTALSIEGVNGAYSVPFTGGRIKVTWQYSAHTTTETCNEYDTLGKTWEEIITIGGCDERPIDCKPEYNTVVVDEEGHTAIYDDTTYKDCEICDSECCYNYDGKGTCKCVILFKEQTPGCTTCESCDVYDEEEQRTITYNKIRYEFVQDCTTICNYDKNTQFEQKEINVDKCFTGETAATVPFTSTTEYYGAGCPAPEVIIDSVEAKANIPTVNNSNRPKVAYEDDMIKVIQAAGPCEVPTYCDCDALTLEGGGGGDCPEGEISYVYGTVNIECRKYVNEEVQVRYTKYCDGTPIGSGTSAKTISVDCNKGTARDITVSGVKLHQAGGCTDEQCGATPPVSDCACSVTWDEGPTIECTVPQSDSDLDAYLVEFNKTVANLGKSINPSDTPCTYTYLKAGLSYAKENGGNDIACAWMIANMISEINPDYNQVEKYFTNATHWGGLPVLNDKTTAKYAVYENRRDSGALYVKFRRSSYDSLTELVRSARSELGVTMASRPAWKDGSTNRPILYFKQDVVPHGKSDTYTPPAPNMTGNAGENIPSNTIDYDKVKYNVENYSTVSDLASTSYQAIYDKQADGCYVVQMFGIGSRKDDWATYFDLGQDLQYTASNYAKAQSPRWRPKSCKYDNNGINYLCDFSVVNEAGSDFCDKQDTCENQQVTFATKTSYPSGHASWGYFCGLLYLLASGIDKTERAKTFGINRTIVRAHWYTDVLVGQANCTACIGMLNGFKEFDTILNGGTEPDADGNIITYPKMRT